MTAGEPIVHLEGPTTHRRGLPLFVLVELENPHPKRTYFTIPDLDWFRVPPPVQFVVTGSDGVERELPRSASGAGEGDPKGFRLGPGERRTMLYDLSESLFDPPLGSLRIAARCPVGPLVARGPAMTVEIEALPEPEHAAVARLRNAHARRSPSWNAFVSDNFRTIEPEELEELSQASLDALCLHLFLHRAVYGPRGVDSISLDPLDAATEGPAGLEAAVLRHEGLVARGDPGAQALERRLVSERPGIAWRLTANAKGKGRVTSLRTIVGAGRRSPPPPTPLPYEEPR